MTAFLSSLWAACAQHFSKWAPRASCGATRELGKHSSCLWRAWRERLFITSKWAGSSTHPGAAPPKHHSLSLRGPPPYSSDPSRPLWQWSRRLWAPSWCGEARRGRPEGALRKWVDASRRQHTGGAPALFLCPGHRQDFAGRNWNKGSSSSLASTFPCPLF